MPQDPDQQRFARFVKRASTFTVHSDAPLDSAEASHDRFNLIPRIGPVYDILRNKETVTPLAVAVYGDWGSGKTSAMRWLQGALDQWRTARQKPGDGLLVHTVWFEPWKYHTREDVWRGLIAEVVLSCIDVKKLSPDDAGRRLISAGSDFGRFLGRSFLHALKALTIKVGAQGAELEAAPGQAIDAILSDYQSTAHPEKAFLNEFENTLKTWVHRYVTEGERLAVFIDDLDRCLPSVALEVLEALKLYLNIDRLVFVVGVADKVVNALVRQQYEQNKVPVEDSRHYLAKMFQVEIHIAAAREQVEVFLDNLLNDSPFWKGRLEPADRTVIQGRLHRLAHGNPREVKRMVNEVLTYGMGVLMAGENREGQADATTTNQQDQAVKLLFAQALQGALIRRILDLEDKYATCARRLHNDEKDAAAFFQAWSGIVRAQPSMPCTYPWEQQLVEGKLDAAAATGPEDKTINRSEQALAAKAPDSHKHLEPLLSNPVFRPWLILLANEDLGELMRIEYPTKRETLAAINAAQVSARLASDESPSDIERAIAEFEERAKRSDLRFTDPLAPYRDPDHPNWVPIPASEFWMGAQSTAKDQRNFDPEAANDEAPPHLVKLSPFRIGRFPVTVLEYKQFVDAGGYKKNEYWQAGGFGATALGDDWKTQLEHLTWPVVNVSWHEAMAFASWASSVLLTAGKQGVVRLPTEAQWERAARGTDGRRYPWGNRPAPDETLANFGMKVGHPTPVGVYERGASQEGVLDLAGNVWEWCEDDWHGSYASAPTNGGAWVDDPRNALRVLRGGSWFGVPGVCRSACRDFLHPGRRFDRFGFRVVLLDSSRTPAV